MLVGALYLATANLEVRFVEWEMTENEPCVVIY